MVIDNILGYAPNRYMRWHGGIYAIRNLVTDRVYIGATGCFFDRHAHHNGALRHNKHTNQLMQADWNAVGEKNFKFEMLISFRYTYFKPNCIYRDELNELELEYWRAHKHNCYNLVAPYLLNWVAD